MINTATNAVTATVPVGSLPNGVAVNPAGTFVYVANKGSNNVSVINTATNSVIATVAVGTQPSAFGQFIFMASPPPVPPPTIALSSAQLQFTYTTGGASPAAQTVTVANSGGGTLTWSAASSVSWLSLTSAPGVLTVSTNPAGLPPATYTGAVTVTASGAVNSPQTISAVLTVNGANCSYLLSSGGQTFLPNGGSGTVVVITGAGCSWAVSGAPSWVTLTSSASGIGTGSVSYTVAANNSANNLSATLSIDGLPYTIQEQGISGASFIGSMPHLAAEGGWTTTFTVVNKNSSSAQTQVDLLNDNGGSLVLPLTFPQLSPSPLIESTVDQTIAANASLIVEASGPANVPYVEGSAQLFAQGGTFPDGSAVVDGFAIFHYDPTAQEAVVPMETRNASSYLLAFDNTNGVLTGIAIENVSSSAQTVPVKVYDDGGAPIMMAQVPLPANGHTSFVLSNNYPMTANIRGTVEIDTPSGAQMSVLGIRVTPPGTLTTIPALANVTNVGGSMAHIASGAGWQTTFVLANTGTNAAPVNLNFFDDNGNPLLLPLTFTQTGATSIASSVTQNIGDGGTLWIQSTGPLTSALLTGSAQLTTTGNIGGYAIFRYTPNGQEAVVPLENRNASGYLLAFDNTNGIATGVAISAISTQHVSVPAVLRDDTGTQIGATSILLTPNGHSSQMLTTLFPAAAGIRGTVEFDTPAGAQISVLGIRSPPVLTFTTLPALAR